MSPPTTSTTSKPSSNYPANRRSLTLDQKCSSWLQEATQYGKKAKTALNEARNLKSELKVINFDMIDRLIALVSSMEKHFEQTGKEEKSGRLERTVDSISETINTNKVYLRNIGESLEQRFGELETKLMGKLKEDIEMTNTSIQVAKDFQTQEICDHITQALNTNTTHIENYVDGSFETLNDKLDEHTVSITQNVAESLKKLKSGLTPADEVEATFGDIKTIKAAVEDLRTRGLASGATPSYADAVRQPKTSWEHQPSHSLIISSSESRDTAGEVIEYIKEALNAKKSGIRVEKLRKVRDRKVILSCSTRTELDKVEAKLKTKPNIVFEEAKNKSPLVIFKNVLSYNTDDEIKTALLNQNNSVFGDLATDISQAEVMYRRRARNQHECHLVLRVTPALYQKLMSVGRVYIDLQRVRVEDQSPLVQCTKCLAYGHGRKICTEAVDLCYYCGGPHLKAVCEQFLAAQAPTCKSCVRAKMLDTSHSVYSDQCPIRKKWDALARSAVAYS